MCVVLWGPIDFVILMAEWTGFGRVGVCVSAHIVRDSVCGAELVVALSILWYVEVAGWFGRVRERNR